MAELWVVVTMTSTPDAKKTDSLGRKRLPKERYSQDGGRSGKKYIVWRCKVCSRAWNVTSKSHRYDSFCRQCGTRNTILMTRPTSYYQARPRVTHFSYYPDAETAAFAARKYNSSWMQRKVKLQYRESGFVKASNFDKLQGSIDSGGHHHPKTKEMT